ncbi:MAG: DEAD/DEAH box helicase family protein [Candidatus Berkelbacteria bacterium]|nr:DEAD/DEAH box helicase family protein [Candidatus Berkelbacteria bacterium]
MLKVLKGTPYKQFRPVQNEALALAIDSPTGNIFEIPTGEGKSLIAVALLLNDAASGRAPWLVTPTKAQVDQLGQMFPNQTAIAFGRSEYPCLYYEDRGEKINAQESPCYMLKCPHRVNVQTGETDELGSTPCPYYQAKYEAEVGRDRGKITVCTTAFFLTNRLFVRQPEEGEDEESEGISVVFDECHNLAKIARGIYEFTLTDYHLKRAEEALMKFDRQQAYIVRRFRLLFMRMARSKRAKTYNLLELNDIVKLLDLLNSFQRSRVETAVRQAISSGELDETKDRTEIKTLENLIRNIPAFVSSLKYSLPEEKQDGVRHPLNYVVAFYYKKTDPEMQDKRHKTQYYLTIKAYFVVPLIKRALGDNAKVTAMSATIGNVNIFGHETGLRMPFTSFPSSFDATKTRVFLPKDTPNLSQRKARRDDPKKARRMVIDAAVQFRDAGHRSLIVTVSNDEREAYMRDAVQNGLYALTYSDEMSAREIASVFRSGEGEVLIGTAQQFGEGLDLPRNTCPVIFFVRPGYPRPDDPMTQFEQKRFSGSHCWQLWQYRVMITALQVRGRNIRTIDDLGVCFFISQQFRSFLRGSLPEWLKPSFVGNKSMDDMIDETLGLLTS